MIAFIHCTQKRFEPQLTHPAIETLIQQRNHQGAMTLEEFAVDARTRNGSQGATLGAPRRQVQCDGRGAQDILIGPITPERALSNQHAMEHPIYLRLKSLQSVKFQTDQRVAGGGDPVLRTVKSPSHRNVERLAQTAVARLPEGLEIDLVAAPAVGGLIFGFAVAQATVEIEGTCARCAAA